MLGVGKNKRKDAKTQRKLCDSASLRLIFQSINLFAIKKTLAPIVRLKFYVGYVDEVIDDCIDGETCRRMDLQLSRYVASVGYNGVDRDEEVVGYFLIAHALHHCHYYKIGRASCRERV